MIATIIISLILAAIVVSISANLIRKRKQGKCSCGCSDCSGCAAGNKK